MSESDNEFSTNPDKGKEPSTSSTVMAIATGQLFGKTVDPGRVAVVSAAGNGYDGLYDRTRNSYNIDSKDVNYQREVLAEIGISADVQLNRQIAKALQDPQGYLNERNQDLERRGKIVFNQYENNRTDFKLSGLSSDQAKAKALAIARTEYDRMRKLNEKAYPVQATQAAREKLAKRN